jgi:drug/metabolite transporter (DMT)-like permease
MAQSVRGVALTTLALVAFAGNSLLCRLALTRTTIDAASFTSIRLIAGALTLAVLVRLQHGPGRRERAGSYTSAIALFVYAAAFSAAYTSLTTGTGALLLFGAVQATMISAGFVAGERLNGVQMTGLLLAYAGLIALVLPGLTAPPPLAALLMVTAGIAWGVYSLRGRGSDDPTAVTAGNFLRAVPITLMLSAILFSSHRIDLNGSVLAATSGAVTSGIGYAVWYGALRRIGATAAATVQLSVPVLAALAGVLLLHEALTARLLLCGTIILGGVAVVLVWRPARS